MQDEPGMSEGVLGAVLAGGESRRMGRDKALLKLDDGKTMVGRAVGVLEAVLDEVIVVAPRRRQYSDLEVPRIADLRPGLGPLGGLHAALVHASGRSVFVLACDLPRVTADLVRWVLDAGALGDIEEYRGSGGMARVVRDRHGPQPLCGLYSGACLPVVERALDQRRLSARGLLENLKTDYLDLDSGASWYEPRLLANANTPQDVVDLIGKSRRGS